MHKRNSMTAAAALALALGGPLPTAYPHSRPQRTRRPAPLTDEQLATMAKIRADEEARREARKARKAEFRRKQAGVELTTKPQEGESDA